MSAPVASGALMEAERCRTFVKYIRVIRKVIQGKDVGFRSSIGL